MRLPSVSETLQNLAQALDRSHLDYMLIGGYALPAYGLIRATVDIDIAIFMKSQDPIQLKKELEKAGLSILLHGRRTLLHSDKRKDCYRDRGLG